MHLYLILSVNLFVIGMIGMFLSRKHIIIILISLSILLIPSFPIIIIFSLFIFLTFLLPFYFAMQSKLNQSTGMAR